MLYGTVTINCRGVLIFASFVYSMEDVEGFGPLHICTEVVEIFSEKYGDSEIYF